MDLSNPDWEFLPYTKTTHRTSYPAIDPKNPANSAAGKVIIVTGGGVGVGKAMATAFVHAGAKAVAILGRRETILAEAHAELEKEGSSTILHFVADVVDAAALESAFDKIQKAVGGIDVTVANAAFLPTLAAATELDVDDWWKGFETNVKGTLLTFRAFMQHKGTNSPTFISLNTVASHIGGYPGLSGYGVSKAASLHLIPFLQAENPDVRVVSMHPGALPTEMNDKANSPLSYDDMSLPMGSAVWLASPAAAWVGGRFLWAHWDVHELESMKEEIAAKNELVLVLNGWPKKVDEPVYVK